MSYMNLLVSARNSASLFRRMLRPNAYPLKPFGDVTYSAAAVAAMLDCSRHRSNYVSRRHRRPPVRPRMVNDAIVRQDDGKTRPPYRMMNCCTQL